MLNLNIVQRRKKFSEEDSGIKYQGHTKKIVDELKAQYEERERSNTPPTKSTY